MGNGAAMAQLNRNAVGLFGAGSNMGNLTPDQKAIYEYYYPSSNGKLFGLLANIVGTAVGSMIGYPMLGSAIGGAMGGGATGGLKGAALGGISGAAGAKLGGMISNGIAGLGSTAAAGGLGASQGIGQAATQGLGAAATSALPNTVADVIVQGAPRAALSSTLGAAGGAAGAGALTQAALANANAGSPGPTTAAPQGVNEVAPIEVMGQKLTPFSPIQAGAGAISGMTPVSSNPQDFLTSEGSKQEMEYDLKHNQPFDLRGTIRDTVSDAAGSTIAGYGTLGLANLLGWIPKAPGATAGPATLPAVPDTSGGFDGKVAVDPAIPDPGVTIAPTTPGTSPGGSAAGAPGLMSTSASGGAGTAAGAPADIKTQGSMAPEVYPWRKLVGAR